MKPVRAMTAMKAVKAMTAAKVMKTMMASPGFRKMATKMVVGMANSDGSNNLLAGGEQRQQLSGPEASAETPSTSAPRGRMVEKS